MKVQPITKQLTFEKKQRFIDTNTRDQLKNILTKMNNETKKYDINEYIFETTVTKRLVSTKNQLGKTLELTDDRLFCWLEKPPIKQLTSNTLLSIGKTELVICNETGEIIDYYKPFFTTWKNIMKRISESISIFDKNFDNPNVVQKKKLSVSGYTEKGAKILFNCKNNAKF